MFNITIEQLNALKASEALQAMVDGLRTNSADPLFRIEMGTSGTKNDAGICFGGAATCAIAELNGELYSETVKYVKPGFVHAFDCREFRRKPRGFYQVLLEFESVIDAARIGNAHHLFDLLGVELENRRFYDDRFSLSNSNWREELPKVEALISELEAIGL